MYVSVGFDSFWRKPALVSTRLVSEFRFIWCVTLTGTPFKCRRTSDSSRSIPSERGRRSGPGPPYGWILFTARKKKQMSLAPCFFDFAFGKRCFSCENQQETYFCDVPNTRSLAELQIAAENGLLQVWRQTNLGPEQDLELVEASGRWRPFV